MSEAQRFIARRGFTRLYVNPHRFSWRVTFKSGILRGELSGQSRMLYSLGYPTFDRADMFTFDRSTTAGHGTGARRQLEIRQMPVTFSPLPHSMPQARALRAPTPLGGWTKPVPGPGTGRQKEWKSFQGA